MRYRLTLVWLVCFALGLLACSQPTAPVPCLDTVLVSAPDSPIKIWTNSPCGQPGFIKVDSIIVR